MNEKERVSYVKALVYIALDDNTIEEGEQKHLNQICTLYGLNDSELLEIQDCVVNKKESLEKILSGITNRQMKLNLLFDLLALCYADNNYSILERQGMEKICTMLKVEDSKLAQMEQLMEEQVEFQKKVNQVLER